MDCAGIRRFMRHDDSESAVGKCGTLVATGAIRVGPASAPVAEIVKTIVIDLRLPRVLLAALTGAGLAIVGLLLQTTTRNELADPFCLACLQALRWRGAGDHPLRRCTGATHAAGLGFRRRDIIRAGGDDIVSRQPAKASGTVNHLWPAVSFLFSALTSYLVFSGDQRAAGSLLFWSLGGLGLARWDNLFIPLLSPALLSGFTLRRWRALDALLAGSRRPARWASRLSG